MQMWKVHSLNPKNHEKHENHVILHDVVFRSLHKSSHFTTTGKFCSMCHVQSRMHKQKTIFKSEFHFFQWAEDDF